MRKMALFFVISLIIFSCEKEDHPDGDLQKTKWELSYIQDTKTGVITQYPGDAAKIISIEFTGTSDRLYFSGICNVGSGSYTYSSVTGEIKITELITTEIYCKYYEWEMYTLQNLYSAIYFKISNNSLIIYSAGANDLCFTKS